MWGKTSESSPTTVNRKVMINSHLDSQQNREGLHYIFRELYFVKYHLTNETLVYHPLNEIKYYETHLKKLNAWKTFYDQVKQNANTYKREFFLYIYSSPRG